MDDRSYWEQRIGTTIRDTWRLDKLLGVGGMAAVFVGEQRIGRRDAIKILHPEVARSAELRARFEQEARLLCAFRHPGAVDVFSMGATDDGLPFLVMELLEGESLADRAKRLNGIPIDEMLRTTWEVLDVLREVHAQRIIHRDIKLDNVFVLNSGRIKLLDFGIARPTGVEHAVKTKHGSMLGTLPYMPPEQIRGKDVDHRADIFATGAMMFRLLARRRIHEANTEVELLVKMSTEPAPPIGTIVKDAPTHVCMIIDRALAFHKERRYPDALTMQNDVRAVQNGQPPPYAMQKLAEGDAPNDKRAPVEPFRDEPTQAAIPAPQAGADAFRDAPTAAVVPASSPTAIPPTNPGTQSLPSLEQTPAPSIRQGLATNPGTSAKPASAIMFAPTMMATSETLGMNAGPASTPMSQGPRPSNASNPSFPASPASPASPTAAPASAPTPMGANLASPAQSYSAITPPPIVQNTQAPQNAKPQRKIPVIAAIVGGVVCLLLLFIAIAIWGGQDDPNAKTTASEDPGTSPTTSSAGAESKSSKPKSTKTKGKRNWDNVRW